MPHTLEWVFLPCRRLSVLKVSTMIYKHIITVFSPVVEILRDTFLFWLIFCFTEHKKSKGLNKSVTAKRKVKVSSTIALSCQKWKLCSKLWGSGKYNYKCGTKTTIHWHVNQRLVQQVLYLIKKEKKKDTKELWNHMASNIPNANFFSCFKSDNTLEINL